MSTLRYNARAGTPIRTSGPLSSSARRKEKKPLGVDEKDTDMKETPSVTSPVGKKEVKPSMRST